MAVLDTELVQSHVRQALQEVLRACQEEWLWTIENALAESQHFPTLESPLEAVFEVWFRAIAGRSDYFRIRRQVEVQAGDARYRFDFVVTEPHGSMAQDEIQLKVAVELDGHAFHEKTKEQVTYRNKRDRDLQTAGYTVLHFSYDEMTRQPIKCVQEVIIAAFGYQQRRNALAQAKGGQ